MLLAQAIQKGNNLGHHLIQSFAGPAAGRPTRHRTDPCPGPASPRTALVPGYEIRRGKFVSFRAPGQERFTRCKTLGEAYTEEAITERIQGRAIAARKPKARKGISLHSFSSFFTSPYLAYSRSFSSDSRAYSAFSTIYSRRQRP